MLFILAEVSCMLKHFQVVPGTTGIRAALSLQHLWAVIPLDRSPHLGVCSGLLFGVSGNSHPQYIQLSRSLMLLVESLGNEFYLCKITFGDWSMDRRLVEAAQTGNVQDLHALVRDNPLLLRSAALMDGETPLHIACIGGHADFVKEVISLRPEFSEELNRDGLSPLHIASANGDVEIFRALLQVNRNMCTIKGKERRIPLHCAAIKGRVHIMRELLSTCPDSIGDVTARGETHLHLALKNNQFEAFKFLVEYLQQYHMESILNKKDNQGDTILHLAVSRKQYEVVELVLDKTYYPEGTVAVNLLNQRGFTPLDVLLSLGGDNEIEEILREAGGVRAEDLQPAATSRSFSVTTENPTTEQQSRGNQCRQSLSEQLRNYFKYDKVRGCPGEVRNTLLVIAVLIATTTYQAVLSPPGGVWQDNYIPGNNSSSSSGSKNASVVLGAHFAGQSIMGSNNTIAFGLFLVFNSIGFFMSLHMINFLTCGFPLQIELQVSLFALTLTYDTSMTALTPIRGVSICFTVISAVLPIIISIATKFIRNNSKKLNYALRRVTPRSA